jgi:bifunctional UDP-N-acetylglucosamine pyrophosphorylase/glucosamine-1-phosphate N-acetyltransferase
MDLDVAAIILAGGRGTRLNSTSVNKVALPFNGRPMIHYALSLTSQVAARTVVVVGAYAQSVKDVLVDFPDTTYVLQQEQLGTGHATQVGMEAFVQNPPAYVLVGYGDHMMFYQSERVRELIEEHERNGAVITFVTTTHKNPDKLAWGRIVRDSQGQVQNIVEQKDATPEERKTDEVNPGLYCFTYSFLRDYLPRLEKSPITGEYYLTQLVQNACDDGLLVHAVPFPFEEVGIGVNAPDELTHSQSLHEEVKNSA